jgi:hypothetical protein
MPQEPKIDRQELVREFPRQLSPEGLATYLLSKEAQAGTTHILYEAAVNAGKAEFSSKVGGKAGHDFHGDAEVYVRAIFKTLRDAGVMRGGNEQNVQDTIHALGKKMNAGKMIFGF